MTVISDWGGVDVLVNNAGVGVGGELKDVPIEDFDWIVGINLMGEVYGSSLFLPGMIERGAGHIVNVASLSGLVVLPSTFPTPPPSTPWSASPKPCGSSCSAGASGWPWFARAPSVPISWTAYAIMKAATEPCSTRRSGRRSWEKMGKEPEEVARIALRAVERDRFMALTGPEAYLLYYMKRLAPGLLRRIVAAITPHLSGG